MSRSPFTCLFLLLCIPHQHCPPASTDVHHTYIGCDVEQGSKPFREDIISIEQITIPAAAKQALVPATTAPHNILVRAPVVATSSSSVLMQAHCTSFSVPLAAQHQVTPHPAWGSHV